MSRERSAGMRQEKSKKQPTIQGKGNLKSQNTGNPTLHPQKQHKVEAANLSAKYPSGQSVSTVSITFGQIRFDQHEHLLYVDVKKGGEQIRCSITQDALRRCFNATPSFDGMQNCLKAHTGEISRAVEKKWSAGKWKDQNKSKGICLEEIDLREFIKK